jgi:tetratricopeptide (TPR) repeat protein
MAIPRHLESALWFSGSGLFVLAVALVVGGLLCIGVAAAFAAPHAAHDLGDALVRGAPTFARVALLAGLLLVPLVLGEGLLGLGAALLAVGTAYGGARQRAVLWLAAAAVVLGAYPVARFAGATLTAFSEDPVAEAAFSAARGFALPSDVARLTAAAEEDVLAARALALHARREGNMGEADARYQALRGAFPDDPVIANNAANVRLSLGHIESALDLYREAVELSGSPVVLFNLAQAYGRAFQVEDLARTLAAAQEVDGEVVAELTGLQGADPQGFVVDLPLPAELMWSRILASGGGEAFAAELRAPLAPGVLGRDWRAAALAFGGIALLTALLASRLRASRWCSRCGRRLCPRCDPESEGGELCEACTCLFQQPETTDRALRLARMNALRERERRLDKTAWLASVLIPGAAGLLAGRPLRSLLGALLFAVAAASALWRGGVAPDPLVAGAAAPFAFLGVAVLAMIAYAAVAAVSLATRRSA